MKYIVLAIIIFSLYLIYRLCFPKPTGNEKEKEPERKDAPEGYEAVIKKHYTCPVPGQPQPTPATPLKSENRNEKALTFAAGSEKPDISVVPPEELDEVFAEDINPADLDIEPDESETDGDGKPDLEEEVKNFGRHWDRMQNR